ncbi:glycoside hydrolase [Naematelia encephala]|uniref:Mannosyl-oligosaccharide glucosidase n=1 Tax=Naematelia encephala TaxID=71784 RepID=A0A1Y2BIX3_9TREE|nr:glycoside hydrolase [Naematelia encephala]
MRLIAAIIGLSSCLVGKAWAEVDDSAAVQAAALQANQSLLWNTYRPQLYHGIRPRIPHSLMTGLMWFGLNDYKGNTGTFSRSSVRYTAEDSDGLSSYSYTKHDGRYFAMQDLVDERTNTKISTSWLKEDDGLDWAVRIQGDAVDPSKSARASVIYHVGLEGLGQLKMETSPNPEGLLGEIILRGSTPQLGNFRIRIVDHPDVTYLQPMLYPEDFPKASGKTRFFGLGIPTGDIWKIKGKDYVVRSITTSAQALMSGGKYTQEAPPDPFVLFQLQNEVYGDATTFAFQKGFAGSGVTRGGSWGFDVFYETIRVNAYDDEEETASLSFDQRFAATFPLPAPFDTPAHREFAQSITSNLIGGIGYYHGASIVDRSFKHDYDDDDDEEEVGVQAPKFTDERELLTATPSRSFFPRGFYWDEGFHLALIGEWDNDLSLEILRDWVALIDDDGWVAREQILGEESRSRVPREFQVQYPSHANPPTLAMAVTSFIRRLKARTDESNLDAQMGFGINTFASQTPSSKLPSLHLDNPGLAHSYLTSIYSALRKHYMWFRRTQRGLLKPYGRNPTSRSEAYRWRGRTADHVLTSGLDDYPRARPPHSGELHVDLMSWMGFFARTMCEISEFLGLEEDRQEYERHEKGILANLDDLHWSEEEQMYCDVSVDEEDESIHVCHRGYISLFPFLLGLVEPDSPHLGPVLDLITDPKHLWSDYGIRSLSRSHPLFGKDENYWRGPIWIQMNWLALKALKERYMVESGPQRERSKEVYDGLRKRVVDNVFKEWQRTGYVWEQYDAETGEGRRSHPFTGWTSLVTMSEF